MRVAGYSALLVAAVAIIWFTVGEDRYYGAKADESIEAALEACSVGNRFEFSRRMVDAKMAIRKLHYSRRGEYEGRLDNGLLFRGCRRP